MKIRDVEDLIAHKNSQELRGIIWGLIIAEDVKNG